MNKQVPVQPWERGVAVVAESLRSCKSDNTAAVVLIGAGMSTSANIPDAKGFIEIIKREFPSTVQACEETYAAYMGALAPEERRSLIKKHIENAKPMNIEHLCLAALVREGYINCILRTNFDPLALRALHLCNVFPAVYDLASTSKEALQKVAERSRENICALYYLHGQRDGPIILNTQAEMDDLSRKLEEARIFPELRQKCWIIIGYSGYSDPVFSLLANLNQYGRGLYWVGYRNEDPPEHVIQQILQRNGSHTYFVRTQDAKFFFSDLMKKLDVSLPSIIRTPFSHLEESLELLGDWSVTSGENLLVEEKKWFVHLASELFEERDISQCVGDSYRKVSEFLIETADSFRRQISGDEAPYRREFLLEAFYLYSRAARLGVDWRAYAGLGETLLELSAISMDDRDKKNFLQIACEKFAKVNIESIETLVNWGNALFKLSEIEEDENEQKSLLTDAENKFRMAIDSIKNTPKSEYSSDFEEKALFGLGKISLEHYYKTADLEVLDRAKDFFISCHTLSPGSGEVCYELARIYSLQNNPEEALGWLKVAKHNNVDIGPARTDKDFQNLYSLKEFWDLFAE
jgi:tetratricopeptide (TPR) repeat protein